MMSVSFVGLDFVYVDRLFDEFQEQNFYRQVKGWWLRIRFNAESVGTCTSIILPLNGKL